MLYELTWYDYEKASVDVAYHPDGKSIVLSFESDTADVSVWTISDPRFGVGTEVSLSYQLPTPDDITYGISDLEFSPDGTQLVGASYMYIGVIWDVATAMIIQTYPNALHKIQFNPTGQNLLTWCSQCYMRVLSPQGVLLQEFSLDYLLDATISANGNTILTLDNSNSLNASIQHWDINTGELLQTRMGLDWHPVGETEVAPNSETVATAGRDQVAIYSLTTGERLMTLQTETHYTSYIAYSPDGRYLVNSGNGDTSQLTFWDATTGQLLNQFQVNHGALAFSPDSRRLAIGGETVQIWDVESQAVVMRLEEFDNGVYYLAYSPDGRVIATADGAVIRLWDSQTGASLGILAGENQDSIIALAFSPNSTHLVSSSWDGVTVVWDMTTYTPTRLSTIDGVRIYGLAYSLDGKIIFAGWSIGPIFVLDAETGTELLRLEGHREAFNGIGFNSDGTRLITGSYDGTIRLWGIPSS
jgi:WD40 repeat protein